VPPIPAIVLSTIGLFRDQRKWLAGAALALALLPFAFLGYMAACT
jgi:hypothetical protein